MEKKKIINPLLIGDTVLIKSDCSFLSKEDLNYFKDKIRFLCGENEDEYFFSDTEFYFISKIIFSVYIKPQNKFIYKLIGSSNDPILINRRDISLEFSENGLTLSILREGFLVSADRYISFPVKKLIVNNNINRKNSSVSCSEVCPLYNNGYCSGNDTNCEYYYKNNNKNNEYLLGDIVEINSSISKKYSYLGMISAIDLSGEVGIILGDVGEYTNIESSINWGKIISEVKKDWFSLYSFPCRRKKGEITIKEKLGLEFSNSFCDVCIFEKCNQKCKSNLFKSMNSLWNISYTSNLSYEDKNFLGKNVLLKLTNFNKKDNE